MSIKFTKIGVRNFLSFGNVMEELDLTYDGTTLIAGDNVDQQSKNGAGKTALINAFSYALYNKPIANISKERLINSTNSSKNTLMEVKLEFESDGDFYEVYRTRGESYTIKVTKNDQDITLDSIAATDRMIVEIIGISYELFSRVVIFSGADTPFLDLPVSTQRSQIEELFKITTLSEKALKLKEKIKALDKQIAIEEALVKEKKLAVDAFARRVQDAETRVTKWESDRLRSIDDLTIKLAKLSTVDFDGQKALLDTVAQLTTQLQQLQNDRRAADKETQRVVKKLAELSNEYKHLEDDKCPYCLQQYEGAGVKLVDIASTIEKINADYEALMIKNAEYSGSILDVESKLTAAKQDLHYNNISSLMTDKNTLENAQAKIQELQESINPYVDVLEKLLLEDVKEPDYDAIDEMKKDLEHHNFVLKLLTDKNSFVRRKIINKTIPFLNKQINQYTSFLGLPHIVRFESDMSCVVEEYGRELDFGNLSSGEKKRVNLSLALAFRDVLHFLHAKMNILFLDEPDGGSMDESGIDAFANLIKRKYRDENVGVWIICHSPTMIGRMDREVIIRKENGFSSIIESD